MAHPNYLTGTIRKKIAIVKEYDSYSTNKSKIKFPFPDIYNQSREMGIPIKIDGGGIGDFVLGTNGGVYYLDRSYIGDKNWNLEQLLKYMKNKYSVSDIAIVTNCVKRLESLGIVNITGK